MYALLLKKRRNTGRVSLRISTTFRQQVPSNYDMSTYSRLLFNSLNSIHPAIYNNNYNLKKKKKRVSLVYEKAPKNGLLR